MTEKKFKNDYSNFSRKQGKFTETKIYRSLMVLYPNVNTMVQSLDKSNKQTIGNQILNNFGFVLEKLQRLYRTDDNEEKIRYLENASIIFSVISVQMKMLQDSGISKGKHYSDTIPKIVEVENQMDSWLNSLKKKIMT